MSLNQPTNADLPFYPFEFTNQFNQKIVFPGVTKAEYFAMQIFCSGLIKEWNDVHDDYELKWSISYRTALDLATDKLNENNNFSGESK